MDRYARLKRQRREERLLTKRAELASRIGHLARAIFEIDAAEGRPPSADVMAIVDEARQLMGIKP